MLKCTYIQNKTLNILDINIPGFTVICRICMHNDWHTCTCSTVVQRAGLENVPIMTTCVHVCHHTLSLLKGGVWAQFKDYHLNWVA